MGGNQAGIFAAISQSSVKKDHYWASDKCFVSPYAWVVGFFFPKYVFLRDMLMFTLLSLKNYTFWNCVCVETQHLIIAKDYNFEVSWASHLETILLFENAYVWNTKTCAMRLVKVPYFNRRYSVLLMSHMLACFKATQWPGLFTFKFSSVVFFVFELV